MCGKLYLVDLAGSEKVSCFLVLYEYLNSLPAPRLELKQFNKRNLEISWNVPLKSYLSVSVKIKTTYNGLSNVSVEKPDFLHSVKTYPIRERTRGL